MEVNSTATAFDDPRLTLVHEDAAAFRAKLMSMFPTAEDVTVDFFGHDLRGKVKGSRCDPLAAEVAQRHQTAGCGAQHTLGTMAIEHDEEA